MSAENLTPILQLLVVVWGVELVLLQRVEGIGFSVERILAVLVLTSVLVGVTLVAPFGGVVVLVALLGVHGLTVSLLFLVPRVAQVQDGSSDRDRSGLEAQRI